jgi:hypothetical protein
MPQILAKASPLVAAINLHERVFQMRSKEYKEQRRLKREAEKAEECQRRQEDEARTERRLVELRRQKNEHVARLFGDGVCADDLAVYQDLARGAKAMRQERKHAKKIEQARALEQSTALETENAQRRVRVTGQMRTVVTDMVELAIEKSEVAGNRQMEIVGLVVEGLVLQVESEAADDCFDFLCKIEALQQRNQNSIRKIECVLLATTKSQGEWAIDWPPEELSNDCDYDWAVSHVDKRRFVSKFLDCLVEDSICERPSAYAPVVECYRGIYMLCCRCTEFELGG